MRRFLDVATRIMIVTALCTVTLVMAQTGSVVATPIAIQANYSAPQTTFFVSNTFDNGVGSLRQAILDANTTPGEDVIHINTIGTVNLLSPLPTIIEAVTIFVEDAHLRFFRVNAQDSFPGLTITGVTVTITGLIVQNGVGIVGGGIGSDGDLTLNAVHVLNSSAGWGGGVSSAGSIVINGGRYEGNSASNAGGAIYAEGALTVNGSTMQNNHCTASFNCQGGGLYAGSTLTMTDTEVINNTTDGADGGGGYGGGVYGIGSVVVNGGRYEGNSASRRGGAIYADGPLTVANTEIISNTAEGIGGGVFASDEVVITGTLFISNTADTGGGAILLGSDSVQVINSRFENNSAGLHGGGLTVDYATDASIVNTLFASNTASETGAAVFLQGNGTTTLKHVTIASSELVTISAIFAAREIVLIQNSIIANHAIGLKAYTGFVVLNHTLFHDNGLDIEGTVGSDDGRVTGDPLFVNPGAADFHLQSGSPAIDAGMNAGIMMDFEGDIRPLLNGFDVGFDESASVKGPPFQIMLPIIFR